MQVHLVAACSPRPLLLQLNLPRHRYRSRWLSYRSERYLANPHPPSPAVQLLVASVQVRVVPGEGVEGAHPHPADAQLGGGVALEAANLQAGRQAGGREQYYLKGRKDKKRQGLLPPWKPQICRGRVGGRGNVREGGEGRDGGQ